MKRDRHIFYPLSHSNRALDDGFRGSDDRIAVDASEGIGLSTLIFCGHRDFFEFVDQNRDQIRRHSDLDRTVFRSQLEDRLRRILVHNHADLPIEHRGVVVCHLLVSLPHANRLASLPASAFRAPGARS